MMLLSRHLRARVPTVLLPLLPLLAIAACSDDTKTDEPVGNGSGGSGGSGGLATGGIKAPTGGVATTGGINSSTGGVATGGASTNPPTGGTSPATGGGTNNSNTGGAANGGTTSASGGAANGGTISASGGAGGTANGGNSAGKSSAGGSNAGNTGSGGGSSVFHVFMLMGQSNMAGVAKKQASDDNTDERLKVLGGCNQPAGQWNTAHPPLNDCPGEKGWNLNDTVDPGIWFGKTILEKLPKGDSIGLVGTAESGESINTFITGGSHHQMILNKIAKAKTAPNARFAGVIFHQGESDNGQNTWPDKVVQLYNEVKQAWGVSYDVPFILGELPAGGCCSGHNTQVHAAADKLPIGAWVSQDGTKVMDEYHFDHASVVLMGQRYGQKMIEELKW
jgi:hypothetical protein